MNTNFESELANTECRLKSEEEKNLPDRHKKAEWKYKKLFFCVFLAEWNDNWVSQAPIGDVTLELGGIFEEILEKSLEFVEFLRKF